LAPAPFIALSLGLACASVVDLEALGVARVGDLDMTLMAPRFPDLSQETWEALGRVALPLVLIIFAESWGSMRSLGLRHGDRLNPQRELFALGLANIASGLLRGLPVGAGFSASSANEAAGAMSRLAGLVAALCMVALAALFAPLVARIPQPVLAAVVVYAVLPALDPRPLLTLWRMGRDFHVALAAAVGVLFVGVVDGMVLAVVLSVVATLGRLASPRIERLGRLADSRAFVDLVAHPEALTDPRILVVRPTEPLFFANAETVFARISDALPAGQETPVVILSLEDSSDLDATALEALIEWEAQLAAQGRALLLARCKQHVRDLLLRVHPPLAAPQRSFWSVDEAFEAALALVEAKRP
jgi:MFS superfamily sulfate permease-like transporter